VSGGEAKRDAYGSEGDVQTLIRLHSPVEHLQPGLEVSRWGTLKVEHRTQMTTMPGVFAAGDIRQSSARQLVAAAGDGASAAVAAARYLRGR